MVMADGEDFIAALDDLASMADAIGAQPNALSLIPKSTGGERAENAAAGFHALAPQTQARLAVALGLLRAPGKMAHWHHTIADESVTRAALAWSPSVPNLMVALAGTTDPRRITFWTRTSVAACIMKTLAADSTLDDCGIGCRVSTPAVAVFLAAIDYARAVRLHSMLTHSAPLSSFSKAEIIDRLRDAASEDFRWPLAFMEKLIPGQMVTSLPDSEVAAALSELVQAGLVESAAERPMFRFELTQTGKVIADGLLHDVSKVALGVTDQQPGGAM
jgi:hypothetical protein